ncbi:alanine racemase [Geodermatophilus sp. DSM 44513]|uniref:alanine racemase n=1 Tax=Geodermatophilus sp. DSM 44513 TaxID=1528104 RepID=UPI001AA129BB|nr:alanine racemase [Geodermatophilus sp. DSM 44513]WNV77621.1 alanine racemase [Geodermatophilus sp. DSM 44513]
MSGWLRSFGSPLAVVLPDQVADNLAAFQTVAAERRIDAEVYYAHKANRSTAFVRRLADSTARIDVASVGELEHALGCGFAPERIMVTGPKTPELLWLCAQLGVLVNVDSLAELAALASADIGRGKLPVLLRFSAFDSGGSVRSRVSRFGMREDQADACHGVLDRCRDRLELRGVAYHLDTVGMAEKVAALDGSFRLLRRFQMAGHPADVIDIGGGFGVNYLRDARQWEDYTSGLTRAVLGHRSPVTWRGHGYGLRAENGRLKGSLGLYPAHRPSAGPAYVADLLDQRSPAFRQRFADLLSETMTRLFLEPGRALVDQSGLVLCRVLETRPTGEGRVFVRVDLNHSDVSLEEHGVLMDPVVLPGHGGPREPGRGFVIGNLCLEADFVSRREIHFRSMPRAGDVLAFVNTAGYFMDFSADHALSQPIARKVAASADASRWALDEEYWPLDRSAPPGAAGTSIREEDR